MPKLRIHGRASTASTSQFRDEERGEKKREKKEEMREQKKINEGKEKKDEGK